MAGRWKRDALWALVAAFSLCAGFLLVAGGVVWLQLALGRIPAEQWQGLRVFFTVYSLVVVLKGLLPQLALALVGWLLLAHRWPDADRRWRTLAPGCVAAASLGFAVVAPALLTVETPPLPKLAITGWGPWLSSYLAMTGGVAGAMLLPRLLLRSLRPAATG